MAEVKTDIIKDFGDGEIRIKITADFVIYNKTTDIKDVETEFNKAMVKYAI